jgi:transposase InsO family protein
LEEEVRVPGVSELRRAAIARGRECPSERVVADLPLDKHFLTEALRKKPVENAFIESFNGLLRDECLDVHQFLSIDDARGRSKHGASTTIKRRPHSSLEHLTPNEFVAQRQKSLTAEAPFF